MPSFPYYKLSQLIRDKAGARGIDFITKAEADSASEARKEKEEKQQQKKPARAEKSKKVV